METSDQAKLDAIMSIIQASGLPQENRDKYARCTIDPSNWEDFRDNVIYYVSTVGDLANTPFHRVTVGRLISALRAIE